MTEEERKPFDRELKQMINDSDDPEKVIETNSDILHEEMKRFQERKWENNRICQCGASYHRNCDCDITDEQYRRWMKRVNREMNDELGAKAMTLLLEKTKRGMHHE